MSESMRIAQLLGLAGVEVDTVEQEADGSWTAHVTTAAGQLVHCPGCGRQAGSVKEPSAHTFAHLAVVPLRVTWHKRRLWCASDDCRTGAFAESGPAARARAGVSEAGRATMGHLIGDWMVAVCQVATAAGVSWHTAHEGFIGVAGQAGIRVEAASTSAQPESQPEAQPELEAACAPAAGGECAQEPCEAAGGVLPLVAALGIDEHRRGTPRFHWDPATSVWVAEADRWQTVFVDSAGGHGLLGQVAGRAKADVTGWLAAQDPTWRAAVRYVTIDMSSVFKSAALAGLLPNARVVVDPFHVTQLANKMVDDVRRRLTYARYGRRGRTGDPEYALKNLLRRGKENLSNKHRHKLLCALADLGGETGRQLGAAWRAKELVRDLLKLSPNRTGNATTRDKVSNALVAFFEFAATIGATVPEIQTLAQTISTWRAEIAQAVLTGHSNAAAEGINRLVKLVYRTAFGLTNIPNQQRRARYTASRSTRPNWLQPVTTPTSQPVAA